MCGYICKPANETGAMLASEEVQHRDKVRFVSNLAGLLGQTREEVADLALSEDGKTVTILFKGGASRCVNVACDSYIAIIRDVAKAI